MSKFVFLSKGGTSTGMAVCMYMRKERFQDFHRGLGQTCTRWFYPSDNSQQLAVSEFFFIISKTRVKQGKKLLKNNQLNIKVRFFTNNLVPAKRCYFCAQKLTNFVKSFFLCL